MGRKQAAGTKPDTNWKQVFRYAAGIAGILCFGIAAAVAHGKAEQFVISNPMFLLPAPSAYGEESPNLEITGIDHASRAQVMQVFNRDLGRSLYLLPLAERRRNLLAVNWVKDAAVLRIWPNRVAVHITERKPVAFVQLTTGQAEAPLRFALIDEDGVILEPKTAGRFKLPVLVGIQPGDTLATRRDRVSGLLRLIRELGPLTDRISEIDAGDLDNLKISVQAEGRVLTLMLGNRGFQRRVQNFFEHFGEISKRVPAAATLDLRLEDRITVVQGVGRAE